MSIHKRLRTQVAQVLNRSKARPVDIKMLTQAIWESFRYCPDCNGQGATLGANLGVACCDECGGSGNEYNDIYIGKHNMLEETPDTYADHIRKMWDKKKKDTNQRMEVIQELIEFFDFNLKKGN